MTQNCDNCKYYRWYYDHCDKYDCEVDAREIHNCFEKQIAWLPNTFTAENIEEKVTL